MVDLAKFRRWQQRRTLTVGLVHPEQMGDAFRAGLAQDREIVIDQQRARRFERVFLAQRMPEAGILLRQLLVMGADRVVEVPVYARGLHLQRQTLRMRIGDQQHLTGKQFAP